MISGGTPIAKTGIKTLLRRLSKVGFDPAFIRRAILPEWWEDSNTGDAALLPEIEFRAARFLGLGVEAIRQPGGIPAPAFPNARLRKVKNVDRDRLGPAILAGMRVAGAVVRARRSAPPLRPPPKDPLQWWKLLSEQRKPIDLDSMVGDLWKRGIAVVPLEVLPAPRFQGLACVVEDVPVVLLGHKIDEPGRLMLVLGHETDHIVRGDCDAATPCVDEDPQVSDGSEIEVEAERYGWAAATGGQRIGEPPSGGFVAWAEQADRLAAEMGIDAGAIVWSWANSSRDFPKAMQTLKALYQAGGLLILRHHFDQNVDPEQANESDRLLLRCVFGDHEFGAVPH